MFCRVALDAVSGIGYSKLRVAFDQEKPAKPSVSVPVPIPVPVPVSPSSKVSNLTSEQSASATSRLGGQASLMSPSFTPRAAKDFIFHNSALTPSALQLQMHPSRQATTPASAANPPLVFGCSNIASPPRTFPKSATTEAPKSAPPVVIGDVAEPFWVQPIQENSNWSDPDELFLTNANRLITATDKKMFWEMARALIDLPELRIASHGSSVRCAEDLTRVLKRPEFRVMWTSDAPQYLPKEVATELILSAYVAPMLCGASADV